MRRADPLFHFRLTPTLLTLLGLSPAAGRALVRRAGLPETAVGGACSAPLSAVRALLKAAAEQAGEDVGLQLAAAVPEGTYDTAELLVRTAPTLELGLGALSRFSALINPVGQFKVQTSPTRLELHYVVSGLRDALGPHMNEYSLAYVVRAIRLVFGALPLLGAWFPHRRRAADHSLAQHFECPVVFGASTFGFAIERPLAARPSRSADAVVFRYLERQAEERLRLLGDRSLAAVVAEVIETKVGLAEADLGRVARHLAATSRTIQRRLEDDGTSFRAVLDQVRQRHAERMMGAGLPPRRIAEVLGFSELRSYRRALKRWSQS